MFGPQDPNSSAFCVLPVCPFFHQAWLSLSEGKILFWCFTVSKGGKLAASEKKSGIDWNMIPEENLRALTKDGKP